MGLLDFLFGQSEDEVTLDDLSGPLIEPMSRAEQEAQFEQAIAAEKQAEFETAFALWKSLGDQGDPEAQFKLGLYYFEGRGTLKHLGLAAVWYKKAAINGVVDAQYSLASMFYEGDGRPRDYGQALEWYLCAAGFGERRAQAAVGEMYLKGLGAPANDLIAYKWCSLAADADVGGAAENMQILAQRMSPERIAQAKALADEWRAMWEEFEREQEHAREELERVAREGAEFKGGSTAEEVIRKLQKSRPRNSP